MPYIGKEPGHGVRSRYTKVASGSETSISGTMTTGGTLSFSDGEYVDVYLNGILLTPTSDYNTSTANQISGLAALSANDIIEIVVYDSFSVFSGEFKGDINISNGELKIGGNTVFSTYGKTLVDDANAAAARTTLGLGTGATASAYVHPNHSGEVTSTADGATVIVDNIVDEANLKISNAGSNGEFLQKQSGNTGGLTWAAVDLSSYAPLAGATFTGAISGTNATLTGYLRGPSSFTIDPAVHGDNQGTVVIAGNLQVDGTTTTINSTTVAIDDLNFSIATDAADSAAANGAGISVGGAGATMLYTHATTSWDFNKPIIASSTVTATGFTGALTGNASTATLASTVTVSDSTANTFFPVVFHDESNALLDDTGALRYNPSTGELYIPKLGADDVYIGTTSSLMSYDSSSTKLTVYDATGSAQSGYLELGANANTNGYNAGAIQWINNANSDATTTDTAGTKCVSQIRSVIKTTDSNAGDDSGGTLQFWTKQEGEKLHNTARLEHPNAYHRVDMVVTAEDLPGDSGAHANAFITTKAKGNYYSGLNITSSSGHVGGWIGHWNGGSSDRALEARVGGTGLNASDVLAMQIDASGNVGIGADNPQFNLHVNKGSGSHAPTSGVDENIVGFSTSYDSAGSHLLTFSNLDGNWIDGTSGVDSAFGWLWSHTTNVRGGLVYDHSGSEQMQMFSSHGSIAFMTTDSADGNAVPTDSNMNTRLQIDQGGNVLIGTTNAGYPAYGDNLTVGDSGDNGITIRTGSTNYGTLYFSKGTGTSNDAYMGKVQYLHDSNGGSLRLATANTDRMFVKSDGNITMQKGLYVGSVTGTVADNEVRAEGNITAYYSDERLKDFTGTIENAIDKVKSLSGYYYSENEKAKEFGFNNQDKKQVGVSAQEIEKVMPEVVSLAPFDIGEDEKSKSGEDYKTVDYARIVPLLIEAIKEQQTQIDELKAKTCKCEENQ